MRNAHGDKTNIIDEDGGKIRVKRGNENEKREREKDGKRWKKENGAAEQIYPVLFEYTDIFECNKIKRERNSIKTR